MNVYMHDKLSTCFNSTFLFVFQTKIYPWLPLVIFGSMSLLGAVLTFILPETRGRKLPMCIAHVEAWTSNIERDNREQMELTNNNTVKI